MAAPSSATLMSTSAFALAAVSFLSGALLAFVLLRRHPAASPATAKSAAAASVVAARAAGGAALIWLVLVAVVFVAGGTWLVARSMPMRIAVLALGLAGVGAYWLVGQPGMGDRPLEMRLAEIEQIARLRLDDAVSED